MKKNTFFDRILPVVCALLIAGMAVYLTGCPSDPGDGGGPGVNNPGGGPLSSITFDLTGATAILVTEGSQGRAAGDTNNILFKVLADDSVQPPFDFSTIPNSNPPKVKFIARSPVAKDIYVCFEDNWSYWTPGYQESEGYWDEKTDSWVNGVWVDGGQVNIGSFIHVKEDGKIYSIVWNEDNSQNYIYNNQKNDPISFDQAGNLYFTVTNNNWNYYSSNSSSVIYKYDPITTKRTPLTARENGIGYENVQLSSDGEYIIVKGSIWDNNNTGTGVDFLRLIPTANPDMETNIFYRTGGGSYIRSFALNPRTKDVYLSGDYVYYDSVSRTYTGSGIYKISVSGTNTNDNKWSPIFDYSYSSNPAFVTYSSEYVQGDYDEDSNWVPGYTKYTYKWTSEFTKDGEPDYDKMMKALKDYFMTDNIEFRHPKYETGAAYRLKDKDALKALYDDGELVLIGYNAETYTSKNPSDFCYKIGSTTVATRVDNYSINNMDTLFVGSNNSVWGIPYSWNSKKVLTQLIDKDGKRDLYIPQSMEDRTLISVKPAESYVYFCADVNASGGQESGYQNVYRFNYNDPEAVQNLFDGIRSRDKNYMRVASYAVSGNYLFFSGTQGINILTGKINLSTFAYTELDFGLRVTSMINY